MNNDRIQEILDLMEEARLDYFLISDPQSIAYCTGYYNDQHERMFVFMISKHGNHTLFMNDLFYLDHDLDVNIVWHKDGQDAIQTIVDEMHFPGRIGIDKNWASHFLLDLMKKLPDAKYINASPCVDLVRMKKDLQEQVLMIESSKINDAVMEEIIPFIQEGVTEKQLAKKLDELFFNHHSTCYGAIVAFGKNAADPHHENDDTLLRKGDCVLIDMGCVYKGYCSDMTRTFFYEGILEEEIKVYELVKKANEAAEAMIKPGVKLSDIDKCARKVISDEGYGKYFTHRLGHFIGRDVHEYGDVSSVNEMEVEEGMIFSIEPGIYLEGNFGVRVEDLVMVTKDGCQVLNSFTKDIYII